MRFLYCLTAALIVSSAACWAADNEAYIDQLGDYATIYVEQDGSANRLGGVDGPIWYANPAIMYGDGQNVDIRQVGSGNYLKFSIFTNFEDSEDREGLTCSDCSLSTPNTFVYYSTGFGNIGTVNVNADGETETSGISLYVVETGDFNENNIAITGMRNTVLLLTTGDVNTYNSVTSGVDNLSLASVTGYLNNISITQSGTKGLIILDIAGNQNTATVTQSGGGALGHWTNLSVSGNLNTHTIAQSGTAADSVVDIKTTGGSNNFNINVNSR
jgi:hypothetical protein